MTTACEMEIRAHSTQTEIIFDLIHIEGEYVREVLIEIDWIRPAGCSMTDRFGASSHQDLGCCSAIAKTCRRQAMRLEEVRQTSQPLLAVCLRQDIRAVVFGSIKMMPCSRGANSLSRLGAETSRRRVSSLSA